MLYTRVASGFRAGGVSQGNFQGGSALGLSPVFQPDKTQNYEIGIKGDVLQRELSFDAPLDSRTGDEAAAKLQQPSVGQLDRTLQIALAQSGPHLIEMRL